MDELPTWFVSLLGASPSMQGHEVWDKLDVSAIPEASPSSVDHAVTSGAAGSF